MLAAAAAAALAAAILAVVFFNQKLMKATPPRRASAGSLNNQIGSKNKSLKHAGILLATEGCITRRSFIKFVMNSIPRS